MGKERLSGRVLAVRGGIAASALLLCSAGGVWAGTDAAAQVDARYRLEPEVAYHDPVAQSVPAAAPYEAPVEVYAPPAGSVWRQAVGPDERAFFDTHDAEPRDDPPVRVHRRRAAPPPDAVEDDRAEPPIDTAPIKEPSVVEPAEQEPPGT